jgi:hypothetical protein
MSGTGTCWASPRVDASIAGDGDQLRRDLVSRAHQERGRKTTPAWVVDADPQASASSWADGAAYRGTPLQFDVGAATAADVRLMSSAPDELLQIDTPPGRAPAIDAAIDAADLVIIPTRGAPRTSTGRGRRWISPGTAPRRSC